MPKKKFLVIHGHFYQPPRENPWLDAVEVEDSAHPYHDWNERISRECYGPNAAARITSRNGRILDIRSNYRKISFNFGPTLLQWMERQVPDIYEDIIEADRLSVIDRGGHGNAIAQAYNHVILPLASTREKLVQIVWGMEDFRERFGRDPEGMWLPECAVDMATLDFLASNGIKYTVLAPRQAKSWRPLDSSKEWESCDGGKIDPTRPYACTLPSGASIVLFFYDGPISQAIAFEGLLNDGTTFANRLVQGFSAKRDWPQLLSIATDGESYGHHHRHGEMALAFAMHVIERDKKAVLTNYGQYLARHSPTAEVRIWDSSSWSCVHGVERWKSDCGCNSGMNHGWQQKWRGPLREAFRVLADAADEAYDLHAPRHFANPQQALLGYVRVLLNPTTATIRGFLQEHGVRGSDPKQQTEALRLLEIMRHSQLLFTSCAWFFDEVSGLETVQNMKYAGRLIQLLREHSPGIEERFLEVLAKAPSNIADLATGAEAYRRHVKPGMVDLHRVVAHYAIGLFDRVADGERELFCYRLRERDASICALSGMHLKICRVSAQSLVDLEEVDTTVCVLHFGGHDFRCSISGQIGFSAYQEMTEEIRGAFQRRSLTQLVRAVDKHFGEKIHSIDSLFSEGKRELLQRITTQSFLRFDATIRMIFEENRQFMEYLLDAGAPLPPGFIAAADFVLKNIFMDQLQEFLQAGDAVELKETARHLNHYGIRMVEPLHLRNLELALDSLFHQLAVTPSVTLCHTARDYFEVLDYLQARIDLWEAQNILFALVHDRPLPAHLERQVTRPVELPHSTISALQRLAVTMSVSLEPYEQPVLPEADDGADDSDEPLPTNGSGAAPPPTAAADTHL